MEVSRRRLRGLSLLELLMAVTIGTTATILLASTSLVAAKTFNKVTQVSRMHTFGRRTFDQFVADVQKADLSLNKFPTWGLNPWFTAKDDQCVILRQPVFKTDNTVDPTKFTIVAYRLIAATKASEGPFVLERTICPMTVSGLNMSATKKPSKIIAKNIKRVNWNQMTSQTFWGDQSTKVYTLTTVPAADTPEIKLQALIGGANRLETGHVTLSGRTLTLVQAMQYGVALDVTYHIEPTTVAFNNGSNGATSIYTRFVFEPRWTSNDLTTKTREITLSAMPNLENKVD
jgi:hypothetical protein